MKILLIAVLVLGGIATVGCALRATAVPFLVGPCAQRQASDDTYRKLALELLWAKLHPLDVGAHRATPEAVERMLAATDALRASWLPNLPDACLRSHAESWLAYYERDARGWMSKKAELGVFRDDYEKRQAEERGQVQALAARLGMKL